MKTIIRTISIVLLCLFLLNPPVYCEAVEYPIGEEPNNELLNHLLKTKISAEELASTMQEGGELQKNQDVLTVSNELTALLHSIMHLRTILIIETVHAAEGHINNKAILAFIMHLGEEYESASMSFESLKVAKLLTDNSVVKKKASEAMDLVDEYGKIVKKLSALLSSYISNNPSNSE